MRCAGGSPGSSLEANAQSTSSVLSVSSVVKTLSWGIFCACSWTWCIGMFLPVVMMDRWGWAGFLVFAVPNVLGCAAFGYVLRDRERARLMTINHAGAMRLFSIVTIAYHVFFIGFIAWWAFAPAQYWDGIRLAFVAPVALLAISALLARLPRGAWLPFALLVYVASLGVFAVIGFEPLHHMPATRGEITATAGGLLWLAPVIALGFLLCPYNDLTFHRALAESPSRHAFAIFGAAFTVMILMSAAYAGALKEGLSWLVLAHMTAQATFTMAAHQRELLAKRAVDEMGQRRRGFSTLAPALVPLLALPLVFVGIVQDQPLDASVDNYLRFLVFYAVVFPGYLLLFIGADDDGRLWRVEIGVFAVVCIASGVLLELAFIHQRSMLALIPPAALSLWWLLRRRSRAVGT